MVIFLSYECICLIHVEMNVACLNFNDVTLSDKSFSNRVGSASTMTTSVFLNYYLYVIYS